ncbi:MAG: 3-mercaptopyruvate sulfurtransferase [Geminicoccaceae bacterium]|nr:3-mercaptopyruvate sulfurtransferase [Geminicoccaceae bacterium]HRY24344.1 3-mercaptopyruvate sulfurtransferase [Geminicoccaceae bacterium]
MTDPLVSTDWLAERLEAPDIRLVDCTWFMPAEGRDPKAEHTAAHLPGAVFFDIDEISESDTDLPHMLPSPAKFSARVRKLGLGDGVRIVVYDNNRFYASARVWWMFRVMGHEDIAVLDGGLAKWRAEGRPVDDVPVRPTERHFTPRLNNFLVRDLEQMRANLTSRREQVVDTRSAARFTGSVAEPREGLRAGHIPGSRNLPASDLVTAEGTLKDAQALTALFAAAGVDLDQKLTTSCGSGVSAAVASLALARLGRPDVALYDGSWTEWGSRPDTPVAR